MTIRILRFLIVPLFVTVIGLSVVGLRTLGQGQPPTFTNLAFPTNGQTLTNGEVVISGDIFAPNGLSQGPVFRTNNLTLKSWDDVRLNITGQDNHFYFNIAWPKEVLQPGNVILSLTATDNEGLSTTVSSNVTVTLHQALVPLNTQLKAISQQRGTELSAMYADLGTFLSGSPGFAFDSALASIWSTMVEETSATGLSQSNPWKPHIFAARNAVNALNPPDGVAAGIKVDTLTFLGNFYDYAEIESNNYLTWIPAPNKDILPMQASVNAYNELAITSSVNGNLGQFHVARGQNELFTLIINLGSVPPLVGGSVHGTPLNANQRLHPILATRPVIDDIYLVAPFDMLQNTFNKGGQ